MKRHLIFTIFLFLCVSLLAKERTEEQMKQSAVSILNKASNSCNKALRQSQSIKKMKEMSRLVIYGYDDGGFAVVSTNDCYDAVIGYSETRYSDSIMPCGFKWWLETANAVMEETVFQDKSFKKARVGDANESVAPLMSTKWGQDEPYNNYCTWNGYQFVTGCVATAMAQVMKYHKYPDRGVGTHSYVISYDNVGDVTFSANFEEHEYDWNNMLDHYNNGEYTETQAEAVATLMSDCGISVDMSYNVSASSAYLYKIVPALKNYYSYEDNTKYYNRSDYTKEQWMSVIYEALSNCRPIIYGGNDSEANGHAFVLHGYDTQGNVYVNWGWDGWYDGYFDIDLLNPDDNNFSNNHEMVIAVPGQKEEYDLIYYVNGLVYKSYKIKVGESIVPEPDPVQEGYTFSGWSEIPDIMPAHDVLVYGTLTSQYQINGHEYVDLGLPSGNAWAATNYGAINELECGQYLNWNSSSVIAQEWGSPWCVPSRDDFLELINNCTWTWLNYNGVNGYKVTGQNGKSIFMRAAGGSKVELGGQGISVGEELYYWTSNFQSYNNDPYACALYGDSSSMNVDYLYSIDYMFSIRPVARINIERPTYTLTYMVDGEVYKSYQIRELDTITPEPAPTKEGYTFSGWIGLPATMPAHDVIVTGSFTVNQYILTYMVDGEVYKTQNLNYGETITPEPPPTKEGYSFSGWSEIPATMPAHDVTVTGTFKYKLTYIVDGNVYKQIELNYGTPITPEPNPTTEGYTFSGWSDIPATMPAHDVTVTGSFIINSYKLIYVLNGQEYKSYDIEFNAEVTPEPDPVKEGYTFSGWQGIPERMPAHDVRVTGYLTINKYWLTYEVDGSVYKKYQLEYGETMPIEPYPTKTGYTFSGWNDLPNTMPAHDVTVTGTFIINKYKLTYKVNYEDYVQYEVEYDAEITPEPDPIKEGYSFSGWQGLPERMPAHDVTVVGFLSINKYWLTYEIDGVVYKKYQLEYGETVTIEPSPTKEGYTFSGWSGIPQVMPAHDVTVTGSFFVNKYVLTYLLDGMLYKSLEVDFGTVITPEPDPEKEGYTFSGWVGLPETMPAHLVIATGTFSINTYTLTYMIGEEVYKRVNYEFGATIIPEPQPEGDYKTFEWVDLPETMPAHDVVVYAYYETGIAEIIALVAQGKAWIYTPDGKPLSRPQKGLNIIMMSDGTTQKIFIRKR